MRRRSTSTPPLPAMMGKLLSLMLLLRVGHPFQVGLQPASSPWTASRCKTDYTYDRPNGESLLALSLPMLRITPSPTSALFMSAIDNNDKAMERKVEGRKKRVVVGYRATAIAFAAASAVALKKSGMTALGCYTVSGPLMAAGMASILSGAATNDRLSSPTYKRLNLILAKYGAIGLTMAALARQTNNRFWWYWLVMSFVTLSNSVKGYGYGVKGWKLEGGMAVVRKDWKKGVKATFQTLFSIPPNLQAAGYLAATVFVGSMTVLRLLDVIASIHYRTKATFIASRLSRYAKLALLTGVTLTLKDAADRGRLEATSFVQLNFISSMAFATMAAYLSKEAANAALVAAAATVAVMAGLNGGLGLVARRMKEKYHDTAQQDPRTDRLPDDIPGISTGNED